MRWRTLGLRPNTVGRRRFAERGMAGLRDESRPGKPAKYGAVLRDRLLAQPGGTSNFQKFP